jgi:hypothetical protein
MKDDPKQDIRLHRPETPETLETPKTLETLLAEIEQKRAELERLEFKEGEVSEHLLCVSKALDKLIVDYMRNNERS